MSDDAVQSCLDWRQTVSTVQLNLCMSFLTTRGFVSSSVLVGWGQGIRITVGAVDLLVE